MHMSDALISPAVGLAAYAASAAAIGYSAKKVSEDTHFEEKIPLMSVMGAFTFAAQMVNFTIPGTGSSGHIGGGILLAALLGPYASLLVIASVLLIQCLIFADGGLLAYGCNVLNIGVIPCLFAYPLIYRPFVKKGVSAKSITVASVASVVIGLQAGAFAVVLETYASGIVELPIAAFAALMQPIHLAIGIVEGLITAAVLCFVHSARPEILDSARSMEAAPAIKMKRVIITFAILAAITGGALSLLASPLPDGLEWSIEGVAGTAELESEGAAHDAAGNIVAATAAMPDYGFAGAEENPLGTVAAGIAGSIITIILAGGAGFAAYMFRRRTAAANEEV